MYLSICIFSVLTHYKLTPIGCCNVLSSVNTIVGVGNDYLVTVDADASSVWFVCLSGPLSYVEITFIKAVFIVVVTVLNVSRSEIGIH